jgi:hypothetical protein
VGWEGGMGVVVMKYNDTCALLMGKNIQDISTRIS